ncbi:hypothetical protein [Paraburkholderia azotifigens]|uniref:Uncharacterized protein n=1 Tax=Paraburkholderia azotifigens TaxID=2057004 RepID=A0A5C6V9Q0_9BURK|nr:hypothetical protein [Paraburkholderia azotifigens]TXC81026.1 hypothetical protein FRZ40_43300 [Paraburkholderia azotifigens]
MSVSNLDLKKFNVSSRIPLGMMLPASQYKLPNLRGPVLEQMVSFNPKRYVRESRAVFNAFPAIGPEMPMVHFVLHLGDARLSWLADPTEPGVWDAMAQWNKNGVVSIALSREETHMFTIPLRHKLGEAPLDALRRLNNKPASHIFATQAIEMFELDVIDANEDPKAPPSTYRHSCLLHTAKVAWVLNRRGYVTVQPRATSDTDGFYAEVPPATSHSPKTAECDTAH